MNKDNILTLIAVLESPAAEKHFNMQEWMRHRIDYSTPEPIQHHLDVQSLPIVQSIHDCGTSACIAGWATVLAKPDFKMNTEVVRLNPDFYMETGGEYLGIDYEIAKELFIPWNYIDASDDVERAEISDAIDNATPKQAAAVLRNLLETNQVDWSIIVEN